MKFCLPLLIFFSSCQIYRLVTKQEIDGSQVIIDIRDSKNLNKKSALFLVKISKENNQRFLQFFNNHISKGEIKSGLLINKYIYDKCTSCEYSSLDSLIGKTIQIDPHSPHQSDPLWPEQTDPLWPA